MAKFHTLKVKEISRPTEESVAVTFEIPEELHDEFSFTQGQHLTLKKDIDGEDIRRSYSICSCPIDETLTVAIKKLEGGAFSTYANDVLKEGDEIEVMPPHGSFYVPLDPSNANSYVAFATGSGITPIMSIIETTLRTEPESEFTLFYGNRRTSTIIFQEELEALKNRYMGRFSLYHILSKERQESDLFNGRIEAEKIQAYARLFFDPKTVDHYFTCGPEEMMLAVQSELKNLGVPEERVHLELFTSPVGKLGGKQKEVKHEKSLAEITVVLDGNSMTFPYDSDKSILDVAFDNGADLPYACKGGVCSTCVCKVEEGEVEMDVNYALEPDELERGLVLSCQSYPKTDKVKLSFDV
ncbi:1,2-phenylacetyl-CoA epoxidase subunit PaaE [Ekhidna sp. To15]|uniref:1,2-phenylacetyl-CoA epoxidase subunit PaaE n=1 Tax=Ekhidna sp. To15 TaxID=3395267 RepID=UPI003F5249F2